MNNVLFFGIVILIDIVIFYYLNNKINNITKKISTVLKTENNRNILEVVEDILVKVSKNKDDIDIILKQIEQINDKSNSYLQKYFLKRFNPFKETGGDQSFVLVLLNNLNDGIIINSLHTRDMTRIYSKEIKNGKSSHTLSSEEAAALKSILDQ